MAEIIIISPEDETYPKERLAHWFPTLPALHALGNLDLLRLPLTALFCSRKCPGDAILKSYDLARDLREKGTPMISGFHTPVEKDMLEILLKGKGPIVICPARGLEEMRITNLFRDRLSQGLLLYCSIANPNQNRITEETAWQRNLLVAALATDWKFIHIERGGRLEELSKSLFKSA